MKPKYLLFVLPLLLSSIFSCKKYDTSLQSNTSETIKPTGLKADTYDWDHPINIRVTLSNTNWQPVFAAIQILPASQPGALPLKEQLININDVELQPVTEVFFALDIGTAYMVKVTDTYGQVYYGPDITASRDLISTSFNGQINAPAIIKYEPSNPTIPPPNPPTPDDSSSHPPIPGVTTPFTVRVPALIEGALTAEVRIMSVSSQIPLQTRVLSHYVIYNGVPALKYDREATFNLEPGVVFSIAIRSENGAQLNSVQMTSGPTLLYYSF